MCFFNLFDGNGLIPKQLSFGTIVRAAIQLVAFDTAKENLVAPNNRRRMPGRHFRGPKRIGPGKPHRWMG
jgi:hypothetical protein